MTETPTLPAITPLTDWIASSDHEPPDGELMYECVCGSHLFLCDRTDDGDGLPYWHSQGFLVPKVRSWRVITGRLDQKTKSEWTARSLVSHIDLFPCS